MSVRCCFDQVVISKSQDLSDTQTALKHQPYNDFGCEKAVFSDICDDPRKFFNRDIVGDFYDRLCKPVICAIFFP